MQLGLALVVFEVIYANLYLDLFLLSIKVSSKVKYLLFDSADSVDELLNTLRMALSIVTSEAPAYAEVALLRILRLYSDAFALGGRETVQPLPAAADRFPAGALLHLLLGLHTAAQGNG